MKKVIIDCDTGLDDALALLLLLRSPQYEVQGITCVAGNVTLDKVIVNTLKVVENSGKDVPVYAGAPRPMLGKWDDASNVHGGDGLGDLGFPAPSRSPQKQHAVEYLIHTYMDSPEPFDLITVGPLTNIALALTAEPRLEKKINSLVMMAGGIEAGNTNWMAEFNVMVDPEAADVVFRSRIPKTMVPLDPIIKDSGIFPEDVAQLEKSDKPWCKMQSRLLRHHLEKYSMLMGEPRPATPPDMAAVGVAIDPSLATEARLLPVAIELNGTLTRGMTVLDRRRFHRDDNPVPNVTVVFRMDNQRYRKLVLDTMLAD